MPLRFVAENAFDAEAAALVDDYEDKHEKPEKAAEGELRFVGRGLS